MKRARMAMTKRVTNNYIIGRYMCNDSFALRLLDGEHVLGRLSPGDLL